jgi:transcriptional regulator with XRE-family HTH domain
MLQRTEHENLILKQFGIQLRKIRISRGFTQEELAAKAGFSRSYYTEIETGKRNISLLNLYRLVECLGINLSELFNMDGHDET